MEGNDFERLGRDIQRGFDAHEAAAVVHVLPLAEMLKDSPDRAIDLIFRTYNRALNEAYTDDGGRNVRCFVESLTGGPLETIPSAVYNAVGVVYPYLERKQKDEALRGVLNILDGINSRYVQDSHTPFIREPLLLSDIAICRWCYWPGLQESLDLVRKFNSFHQFSEEAIDERGMFKQDVVKSDFLMALSLMHKKYSKWGEDYVEVAQPDFLQRVFQGVIAHDFARVSDDKVDSTVRQFRESWPDKLCGQIDFVRSARDWVDIGLF